MNTEELLNQAKAVLKKNDQGTHTIPAEGLYPHQWLWDSCFIAIGLRHLNTERAKTELISLLRGQWSNGMLPHMIINEVGDTQGRGRSIGSRFWQSSLSPNAPDHVATSGITQPPLASEAAWHIAQSLDSAEAKTFLKQVFEPLVRYHEWLYKERDLHQSGLVSLFHPWETGLDNTPKWMSELQMIHTPLWIKIVDKLRLTGPLEKVFRKDTKFVPAEERLSTSEALRLIHVALGLRKRHYDIAQIVKQPHFIIESLSFNCILIANNSRLVEISKAINRPLPEHLLVAFERAEHALENLWSEQHQQYCHRNVVTGELVAVTGISQLMPLYSGKLNPERRAILVKRLKDPGKFWLHYPVPSVPKNAPIFNPRKYWQGPTWINTNWLIIKGLEKNKEHELAQTLRQRTLDLVQNNGMFEYFSPLDGKPAGAANFSWTAALTIDLLKAKT